MALGGSPWRSAVACGLGLACVAITPTRAPQPIPVAPAVASPRPAPVPEGDSDFAPEGERFASGRCAGFERALLDETPVEALSQRVRVRLPHGMRLVGVGPGSAATSAQYAERANTDRALSDLGDRRLVVTFEESSRRPGARMLTELRALAREEGARLHAWRNDHGLRVVMLAPTRTQPSREAVSVADAWVAMPDGLLVQVMFYVNPEAARDADGCPAIARAVLSTVDGGSRAASLTPRVVELERGITLTLGDAMVHARETGPDFTSHRVEVVTDLGAPAREMGVYLGAHPQHRERPGATEVPGTLFGQPVQWSESTGAGGRHRQAWIAVPGRPDVIAHVFVLASDDESFQRLCDVAASLAAR